MHFNTFAIISNIIVPATAAVVPTGTQRGPAELRNVPNRTLAPDYRAVEQTRRSETGPEFLGLAEHAAEKEPDYAMASLIMALPTMSDEPNYAAASSIMALPTIYDGPDYIAAQELIDKPDPMWAVFTAPGEEPKNFLAFCAEAPYMGRINCYSYPNLRPGPFHHWYVHPDHWQRCITHELAAGRTPKSSCFNTDRVHGEASNDAGFPVFTEDAPPFKVSNVGRGLARLQQDKDNIHCLVVDGDYIQVNMSYPEDSPGGLQDLLYCYKNWDWCSADFQAFYKHYWDYENEED